jgi:hypothetical protein
MEKEMEKETDWVVGSGVGLEVDWVVGLGVGLEVDWVVGLYRSKWNMG